MKHLCQNVYILGLCNNNEGLQALLQNFKSHGRSLKISSHHKSINFHMHSKLWKLVIRSSDWQANASFEFENMSRWFVSTICLIGKISYKISFLRKENNRNCFLC